MKGLAELRSSSEGRRLEIENKFSLSRTPTSVEPTVLILSYQTIKIEAKASFLLFGGDERIRTFETLLPTRFRVVRLQPLGHISTHHSTIEQR